mgnify:CR=1 FL=1
MKYLYLFSLFIFFFCQSPNGLKKKKNISEVQEISLDNNFQIYIPKKNSFVDSIVNSITELRDLKISIEDLTKLNPKGIESFLDETLIKCDNLLNLKNKNFISRPEIRGRLKVLKINILKCKFYNHQNDIKNLNENLKKLFMSYNILLERLEGLK